MLRRTSVKEPLSALEDDVRDALESGTDAHIVKLVQIASLKNGEVLFYFAAQHQNRRLPQ